jgi:sugar lactone lactonase YvrE
VAALLALLAHTTPAGAYATAQPLLLNSISQVDPAPRIDGDLSDWGGVRPAPFVPFDLTQAADLTPELQRVAATVHAASVRAAYDDQALYVGIEWRGRPPVAGAQPGRASDALGLHVLSDRLAHFLCDPLAPGAQTRVRVRYGDNLNWSDAAGSGASCFVAVGADGKSYVQEMRLPWKTITSSGQAPADGRLRLMFDFSWSDLTSAIIAQAPLEVLHGQKFITATFLSSPDRLFDLSGYLPNVPTWGTLQFSTQLTPNETQPSPLATGATVTHVAPAGPSLAVDGDLQEWPAELFQTISYAPGYLGDRYSGKVAASYDANNLYLALHAHTGAAAYNVEHEANRRGYWGGDNLQVRLSDGKRTLNLCAWYDSLVKQPALTADGKDLAVPFLLKQGAREAYRSDADGQGYSLEIALPYTALGFAAPQAGSAWKGTFQLWWAALEPQFSGYSEATLQPRGGLAYRYTIPKDANVTLGAYDTEGRLLRWIVRGSYRHSGANVEYWDGLDQWGEPLAAGAYQVKGIAFSPLGLDYQFSIGNSGTPPWPTADGKGDWIGDESTPQAAATEGDWVYLASPCNEKGWSIVGVDGTGQRQWGFGTGVCPRSVSLTVAGDYLYALYSGPENTTTSRAYQPGSGEGRNVLVCLDKRTGKPASFSVLNPSLVVNRWPYNDDEVVSHLWDLRANKSFNAGNYGGQPRYSTHDIGESTNSLGIAATGGRLYLSLFYENKLWVLDAATAKQVDEIPVPQPVGLHALPGGKLLVVSGASVLEVDPQTKTTRPVIDHDLVAPHDVTLDKDGNIYVSDWGASFQVKVFSPAGQLLRAIGTPGGRPWVGKWDANGMLVPRGIAVTDAGKLWVAEDDNCPSRVSVWNAGTGALIRDYLGPSSYGGGNWFWVNPQDPTMIMTEGAMYKVDYAKRTWTPTSIALRRMSIDQPFMPNGAAGMPTARTVVHDGKPYLYVADNISITALRLDGDVFTPVAAIGLLDPFLSGDGTGVDVWDSDLGHHRYLNWRPSFFAGHVGQIYTWHDQNGDGKVQAEEMQWAPVEKSAEVLAPGHFGNWDNYWGGGIGPDGSLYFRTVNAKHHQVYRLDVEGWTAAGAPVYTLANAHRIISSDDLGWLGGLYVTNANKLIASYSLEWPPLPKNAVECYDRDGKFLWAVARYRGAQQIDDPAATNMSGDFPVPGMGNVIGSWEWHLNQHSYLLTDDGLYLSWLCDDNVSGPTQNWGESMRSYFQTPAGETYIVNGGADAYHLLRITGLEGARRFTGQLVLTEADVAKAAAARVAVASAPPPPPQPVLRVNWLKQAPVVDGDLSEWNLSAGVTLSAAQNRSAEVALGRDAANLYLAYRVHGSALSNKGADWRTLFLSGDCVDLMLSTGPALAAKHFAPAAGDERLLLSLYNGEPTAVLYRPVVPGATTPVRLMATTLDQITRLDSAHVVFHREADGYAVEASVPLTDLGLDPATPTDLRGDVGVIYADQTGANRALRQYYYNQNTKIVNDLTTEATLQPGDWGPIEMALGPNLLSNGGFESPLATDVTQGWVLNDVHPGTRTAVSGEVTNSGHGALLLQADPVVFTPESYSLPDYRAFLDSANGGKGGGHVAVMQTVPVTAGARYWVKAHYRTLEMSGFEKKNPGPGRGYIALSLTINWPDAKNGRESWQGVFSTQLDYPAWQTAVSGVPNIVTAPFTAPEGATRATVIIRFVDNYADKHPSAWVDDVEFVPAP